MLAIIITLLIRIVKYVIKKNDATTMKVDTQQSFPRPRHFEAVSQAMVKRLLGKYILGP